MNYRALVAYDGTAYHGWQQQTHDNTVAGTLQSSFIKAFSQEVALRGASRTDAGVHALGQVVRVTTNLDLEPKVIRTAWNARLPHDIHIRALCLSSADFNPLAQVIQKTYYYHFFLERPLPFIARYGAIWHKPVNFDKLQERCHRQQARHGGHVPARVSGYGDRRQS